MKLSTKKLVTLAMLAALAYIAVLLFRIPLFTGPMEFLKLEPKDVIIVVAGFMFGPLPAAAISVVVSLLEMVTISSTGPIGAIMNMLSSCSFACTAAFIYKRRHTMTGALLGLICGSISMVAVMLLWNWLITPYHMQMPRAAVEALLIPYFLPFNAIKAGLNTALAMLLYKPLVTGIRKAGLLPPRTQVKTGSKLGFYLLAALLLVSCILVVLAYQGIL